MATEANYQIAFFDAVTGAQLPTSGGGFSVPGSELLQVVRVLDVDGDGLDEVFMGSANYTAMFEWTGATTGFTTPSSDAIHGALAQNSPNPFNPKTTIRYTLPSAGHIILSVYDVQGRQVKTLVDGWQAPGHYSCDWDGTNDSGNEVASGSYFYQLSIDGHAQAKTMILVK